MKNLIENVGELVRELRLLQKISLRTLAKRIDRSPAFPSQLERNISKPSLKDIYAIAEALKRPVSLSCRMFCPARLKKKAVPCEKKHRRRMESQGIIAEILSPKLSKGVEFNQDDLSAAGAHGAEEMRSIRVRNRRTGLGSVANAFRGAIF